MIFAPNNKGWRSSPKSCQAAQAGLGFTCVFTLTADDRT